MKIFEKREFIDGGPNDRGIVIGYLQAKSKEHAKKLLNLKHNFIQVFEISEKEFLRRKKEAWDNYQMFKIKKLK